MRENVWRKRKRGGENVDFCMHWFIKCIQLPWRHKVNTYFTALMVDICCLCSRSHRMFEECFAWFPCGFPLSFTFVWIISTYISFDLHQHFYSDWPSSAHNKFEPLIFFFFLFFFICWPCDLRDFLVYSTAGVWKYK